MAVKSDQCHQQQIKQHIWLPASTATTTPTDCRLSRHRRMTAADSSDEPRFTLAASVSSGRSWANAGVWELLLLASDAVTVQTVESGSSPSEGNWSFNQYYKDFPAYLEFLRHWERMYSQRGKFNYPITFDFYWTKSQQAALCCKVKKRTVSR